MALRESIVQVVHHVHAFTQLHAQPMSVQAIAITTMREVSVPRVLEQHFRATLLSVLREAIAHVTTTIPRVAMASVHRAVMVSVLRVAMVSVHRAATVSVHRAVMASVHRAVMVSVLSRAVTVAHSRVATVVLSRVVTVVLNRVVMVVLSRVAMASLTEHLTRRVHVSTQPTTIQMQSTL